VGDICIRENPRVNIVPNLDRTSEYAYARKLHPAGLWSLVIYEYDNGVNDIRKKNARWCLWELYASCQG
jgi:hypothetical protein